MKDADVRKVNIDQLDKCQVMDVNLGSSNESVFLQGMGCYDSEDCTVYVILKDFGVLKLGLY